MMIKHIVKALLVAAIVMVAANGMAASDVTVDNGTTLFGAEISSISINPATGQISIFTKSGNWTLMQGGGNNPPPDNNDPVPTVVLKVDGLDSRTVDLNTDVTLAWTVEDAASCETLGGNSAWDNVSVGLSNGSSSAQAVIKVNFTSTVTFVLRCQNGGNTVQDSVSITGKTIDAPDADCPAVGDVDVVDWNTLSFNRGYTYSWPSPNGNSAVVTTQGIRPLAIRFNTITASAVDTEYGVFSNAPVPGSPGAREMSLTECPGDFEAEFTCRKEGTSNISWEIDNSRGYPNTCALAKGATGKTYYLNVRFPDGCESSTCKLYIASKYY